MLPIDILRIVLGAYLLFTGSTKALGRRALFLALLGYGLPRNWALPFSFINPIFELAVGLALVLNKYVIIASALAAVGACAYLSLAARALAQKKRLESCGCYGAIRVPLGWWNLAEDILWLTIALAILFSQLAQPL